MKLARGITGFYCRGDVPPTVDEKTFRSVCHTVAQQLGGKVQGIDAPGVLNFFAAHLSLAERELTVLLNAHHPYVAFAEPTEVCRLSFDFVDWPGGAQQFESCGEYRVFTTTELAMPLDSFDLSELADAELEQIKYWKARNLHEILFNGWD